MNTLLDSAERWLHAALTLSWKGALLALAVGLAILFLRKRLSPAWRHGLWLLVLLRFVLPDVGTSSWSMNRLAKKPTLLAAEIESRTEVIPIPTEPVSESGTFEKSTLPDLAESLPFMNATPAIAPAWRSMQKMCLVWLLGVGVVLGTMVFLHVRLLWRLRRKASQPSTHLISVFRNACTLAGVRRTPRLIVSDVVQAPALFGILRPAILLPSELAMTHDTTSLRLILLHEIAHLQRRDLWVQLLSSLIVAVHWFNPVVWWAARRMRAEAEMAADARALRSTDATDAHRLGEVLLGFANHAATGWMVWFAAATLLGISENKRDLRHRIEALMDIARGRRTRSIVGLAAFSLLAVFGLTKAPAQNQNETATQSHETPKGDLDSPNMIRVHGIVVDSVGNPVSGAAVRLSVSLAYSPFPGPQDQKTGPDGRFLFKPVSKAAHLNVNAKHPNYADSSLINFKGYSPNEERRLVLRDIPWIVGKITDKRSGQPIKNARVFYGLERNPAYQSRYQWIYPTVRTSETGEYRLPIASRDADNIIIRAWLPGMTSHAAPLKVAGKETPFSAQLEPAERLSGKVIDAEGKPVLDAFVWVAEDAVTMDEINHPLTMDFLKSSQRSRLSEARVQFLQDYSKADGHFELDAADPLLKEHFWIAAIHPEHGFAKMNAAEFQAGALLKLEPWGSMSGQLVSDKGVPLANTTGTIRATVGREVLKAQPDALKMTHILPLTTDKEGQFKIDRLMPGTSFSAVTINREYRPIDPVTVVSGPLRSRRIQLAESRHLVDESQKRSVQGRIVLPEGYSVRSDAYSLFFVITSNDQVLPGGSPQLDAEGRFMTAPLPLGNHELRITLFSRNPKFRAPSEAGRWMRFKLEPNAKQAPLDLGQIIFKKEDFVFPLAGTFPAPSAKTTFKLDIPITPAATMWSASGIGSTFTERQPLTNGRIVGELSSFAEKPFLIQVVTAEGAVLYSQPMLTPIDPSEVVKGPLTFTPGVTIKGTIQDLPATEDGTGWVIAQVLAKPDAALNQVFKGFPSSVPWSVWAPVAADGSFHFAGLPSGQVTLTGLGKGWVTKFSYRWGSDSLLHLDGSTDRRDVTLETQPCLDRSVRLLMLDGRPAAGAKVEATFFGIDNIHLSAALGSRSRHTDEPEKYAQFEKAGWLGQKAFADDDGKVTLINQPPGEITYTVTWTDSKTGISYRDQVKLKIDSSELLDVTVAGKPL